MLSASNDVTAALRETHALMQAEVSRSHFAYDTLRELHFRQWANSETFLADEDIQEQSTAVLSTLSESYSNLDALLSSSRSLISSLVHSQKSDTWYLESAFWILVITIAWLVFRRLLYGPGWWFLYLPISLIWRLTTSLIQVFFGALITITGAVGGASQSSVPSAISESVSTTLIVQPSATGGIPKFHPKMSAPTIAVGGGGGGAKDQRYYPPRSDGKLTEQVGKMTEESTESEGQGKETAANEAKQERKGTVLRERNSDEPPNPKKRMWQENTDPSQRDRTRDEL